MEDGTRARNTGPGDPRPRLSRRGPRGRRDDPLSVHHQAGAAEFLAPESGPGQPAAHPRRDGEGDPRPRCERAGRRVPANRRLRPERRGERGYPRRGPRPSLLRFLSGRRRKDLALLGPEGANRPGPLRQRQLRGVDGGRGPRSGLDHVPREARLPRAGGDRIQAGCARRVAQAHRVQSPVRALGRARAALRDRHRRGGVPRRDRGRTA